MSDMNQQKYEVARRIAIRKMAFIRHAIIYLVVVAALLLINNLTYGGYQWWIWPAIGWGIGVSAHFLAAFLPHEGSMIDNLAKREMEKMDEKK
jgi:uncharacterized membrane protein YdbT with pleckstrin-like domain